MAKVSLNSINSSLLHTLSIFSPSRSTRPAAAAVNFVLLCALTVDAVFGVAVSAPLCEACSNDIHQTTSALHNIKAIVSEPAHSKVVSKL